MALLLHISIALVSVGFTTFVFFTPSRARLRISYLLVVLTLGSGTYLVINNPAHMLQACISGLAYTMAVTIGIVAIQYRLATAKNRTNISPKR